MEMEPSDAEFEVVCYVPRPSLPYNAPGTTYTLIKLPEDASSGLFSELAGDKIPDACKCLCFCLYNIAFRSGCHSVKSSQHLRLPGIIKQLFKE